MLILSGEWKDSCVPAVTSVQVTGGSITVFTESRPGICLMVITSWSRPIPLGRLQAGSYSVTVTHSEQGMPARVIGRGSFTVQAKVCKDPGTIPRTPELATVVEGNTAFAVDLYHKLREGQGNLVLSPYNVWLCLAMAYAGARGETEQEMATALRFSLSQVSLHPALGTLQLWLKAQAERTGVTLTTGNAFWGQEGWPFRASYKDLLAEHYGAELFEVPFATDPGGSRQRINAWVLHLTRGKIPELLPSGSLTPLTRLVLTSAIYFYGTWKYKFDPNLTRDRGFCLLDGSVVQVPMMRSGQIRLKYSTGKLNGTTYEAVELPYTCEGFSMVLLVPEQGRFWKFERALTADGLAGVLGRLRATDLRVIMPTFTFRYKFSLVEALQKLGMPSAFSSQADFSGMEEARSVFISEVIHEAFIAVDEVGTEAAAATAVVMTYGAPQPEVVEIVVDRPFLFLDRVLDPRR